MRFKTRMRVLRDQQGRPRLVMGLTASADGCGYYATTLSEDGQARLEVLNEEVKAMEQVPMVIAEER